MYVVIRTADVGEFDTLAIFEDELDAEELAALANARDNGPDWSPGEPCAYISSVDYTPLSDSARQTFRDIFDEEPPNLD